MQSIVSLILSLFIITNTQKTKLGFGEGEITINQYNFSDASLVPKFPSALVTQSAYYNFTYYIKKDKILRKDKQEETPTSIQSINTNENVKTSLKASLVHPNYLIDWKKRTVYAFIKKEGAIKIVEKYLQKEQREYFYRLIDGNKTIIKCLEKTNPVSILNMQCFKGVAIAKSGDSLWFYYSPTRFKVHSPLNSFLPSGFPYEVVNIKALTNWTNMNSITSVGAIVFQIAEIKEYVPEDSIFTLPPDIDILQK
jgi:hypothetical protein